MAQHAEAPAGASQPVDRAVVCRIIDVLGQPAFLITDTGRLLHHNAAARAYFERAPDWLASCAGGDGAGPPRWARRVAVGLDTTLVLVDSAADDPEGGLDAPWVARWKLPPRLARVTACLACGLTDKAIAARLGISYQTVRTYVKQVYQRTQLCSRAEIMRAIHDGSYWRERVRMRAADRGHCAQAALTTED